jgi:hypothetical protein
MTPRDGQASADARGMRILFSPKAGRMTYGAFTSREFADLHPSRRTSMPQAVLCAIALTLSASAGLWVLYGRPAAQPAANEAMPAAPRADATPAPRVARPSPFAALIDPALTVGYVASTFGRSAPLAAGFQVDVQVAAAPAADASQQVASAPGLTSDADPEPQVVASIEPQVVPELPLASNLVRDIPLPLPRPAFLARGDAGTLPRPEGRRAMAALAPPVTPSNPGGFFDRFFGGAKPANPALAYAASEEGTLGPIALGRTGAPDRWTAVYDIASHTVTLPDGSRLEAHSGLGANKDNPNSVAVHMSGATPPAVYDLTPREALFHGVRALRLNPVGDVPPYGRMGLLAHTYRLGPRGDSNGCVVFRDYAAFRRAYDSGMVRRLVVVAGL